MNGELLRSGRVDAYKPLGREGSPVYRAARQLREAIRLQRGADVAAHLAIPQPNAAGDSIDWYAPHDGLVVPWSSASAREREDALAQLTQARERLIELAATMKAQHGSRESLTFGRLLDEVIHFPSPEHVYLVDGRPVITFWGFTDAQHPSCDPLDMLRAAPVPITAPAAAAAVETPPPYVAPPPPPRGGWQGWLWWLLGLLLLLLLVAFLLSRCVPQLGIPPLIVGEQEPAILAGPDRSPIPDDEPHGRVDMHGQVPGDAAPDGEAAVGGAANGRDAPADADGDGKPDQQAPADAATPEAPPAGADGQRPSAAQPPAGEPLRLPDPSVANGNTDFLNGQWRARTGLTEAGTGRPIELEYQFRNGQGTVRVHGANGEVCEGAVSATMKDGQLHMKDGGAVRCPDGTAFRPAAVTCKVGAGGSADCTGKYEGGDTFEVGIERAAAPGEAATPASPAQTPPAEPAPKP